MTIPESTVPARSSSNSAPTSACSLPVAIVPHWAGLCPGNNQSAGKRRHGRTRRGNLTLREVLIECAHAAARTHHCQFRGYYKALTVRRVCIL